MASMHISHRDLRRYMRRFGVHGQLLRVEFGELESATDLKEFLQFQRFRLTIFLQAGLQ